MLPPDVVHLAGRKLLKRGARIGSDLAKKTFQAGGRNDPEELDFLACALDAVPHAARDVECGSGRNLRAAVSEDRCGAAFLDVEDLVGLLVFVDEDSSAGIELLSAHGQTGRPGLRVDFDYYLPVGSVKDLSLPGGQDVAVPRNGPRGSARQAPPGDQSRQRKTKANQQRWRFRHKVSHRSPADSTVCDARSGAQTALFSFRRRTSVISNHC